MIRILKYLLSCTITLLPIIVSGQNEVSEELANPRTLAFDNQDISVVQYLYSTVNADTTCCESANFLLKIEYDQTGTVRLAEAITDKNTCTIEIITQKAYKIRWDAKRSIDSKTIYLEINHKTECNL